MRRINSVKSLDSSFKRKTGKVTSTSDLLWNAYAHNILESKWYSNLCMPLHLHFESRPCQVQFSSAFFWAMYTRVIIFPQSSINLSQLACASLFTNKLHSQPGSQSAFAAIGGYCTPSFSTLGSHVHQEFLSILSMTMGTC